jgi:hypothetical protein
VVPYDRTFQGAYDLAPEELLFQIDRTFSYPDADESRTPWWIADWDHAREDAIVIGVEPDDAPPWIGHFPAMLLSPRGTTGVIALPDGESLAACCRGTAYRVWAADPRRWEQISAGGLEAPVVVTGHELVLFVEHTHVVAYGTQGLAWESERLVSDDLHALRVEGDALIAEGFDAPYDRILEFAVDLRSGTSDDAPSRWARRRDA